MAMKEETKQHILKLWNEGKSGSEIARIVGGTTANAVIGIAHRARLKDPGSVIRKADPAKARKRKAPPIKKILKQANIAPQAGGVSVYLAHRDTYAEHKPIWLITQNQCKWPVEHTGHEHLFCCSRVEDGVYCPTHTKLAYNPK